MKQKSTLESAPQSVPQPMPKAMSLRDLINYERSEDVMSNSTKDEDRLAEDAIKGAQTAARNARREREFGGFVICIMCGYVNPFGMIAPGSKASEEAWNLFEEHHLVGRNHDLDLRGPFCQNCHAELHAKYRDGAVELGRQPTLSETLISILTMLAILFRDLAEALMRWVERIRNELLPLERKEVKP